MPRTDFARQPQQPFTGNARTRRCWAGLTSLQEWAMPHALWPQVCTQDKGIHSANRYAPMQDEWTLFGVDVAVEFTVCSALALAVIMPLTPLVPHHNQINEATHVEHAAATAVWAFPGATRRRSADHCAQRQFITGRPIRPSPSALPGLGWLCSRLRPAGIRFTPYACYTVGHAAAGDHYEAQ